MEKLLIDEEFKILLPALDEDTLAMLEANLLENGCRDPLVVWGNILIDGHNRYDICTKHGIPFTTVPREFNSRDDVLIWIISTQVSRRNLTPIQLSYYRGLHYMADKRLVKNSSGRNQYSEVKYQNEPKPENQCTAARLSTHYNVSPVTIKRDSKVAEAINAIGETSKEAKRYILSGKTNITRKRLNELLHGSESELINTVSEIEGGTFERKKTQKMSGASTASPHNTRKDSYSFTSQEEQKPLNEIIIRITEGFLSDLHRFVSEGGEEELRKALKAYIDVLEDIHRQM